MTYNFERLSDFDFECLVRDLLEAELKVRLEHFTRGRDRGIDLRYAESADKAFIVQCKHYLVTGYAGLKSNIKNKEAPKVRALAPRRLILATTVPLTPERKDELLQLLSPHVLTTGDILGATEIEALIGKHKTIERRHFKLWLTSTGVLERVIHSKVHNQSDFLRRDIEEHAKRYVQNESFPVALELLKKHRVCIIAGPPGIGKTTLAQMLMLQLSSEGYELFQISEDVSEGTSVWDPEKKQFFYYDDFLGQTAGHEKLRKNEDDRLAMFLRQVNKTPNKVIVLTTREYILEQARTRYERLFRTDFEPWTCVVELSDYTKRNRAQILYNHLYFSDTPPEMLKALRDSAAYKTVIAHPKFNPRLVEFVAAHARQQCQTAEDFPAYLLRILEDPEQLWAHPFEQQLDDGCRALLLVLATLPLQTPLESVRTALAALNPELGDQRRFRGLLRILDGDFVRTQLYGGLHVIGFANPSLRDYVVKRIKEDAALSRRLFMTAQYFDQVSLLSGYVDSKAMWTERAEAFRRTLDSESCVVVTTKGPLGQELGSIATPTPEKRLATVISAGGANDDAWLSSQIDATCARWERGYIDDSAEELIDVLDDGEPSPIVDTLTTCLRDSLLNGFESRAHARLWYWLADKYPDICTDHSDSAIDNFYVMAEAEIDELARSESDTEIEEGKEDLKDIARLLGCDFDAIDTRKIDEQLDNLAGYADAHEDDWRESYREERHEAASDEQFVDDLFDGLARKDE